MLKKTSTGVTMIELLLVIVIIGILTGTVVSIINPRSARNTAEEAAIRKNLMLLCEGVENFREGENERYPAPGANGNPLDAADPTATDAATFSNYIQTWLPGAYYKYKPKHDDEKDKYTIQILRPGNTGLLQCSSKWPGEIKECTFPAGVVLDPDAGDIDDVEAFEDIECD